MAERYEPGRLREELGSTAARIEQVTAQLEAYVRQQGRIERDMQELKDTVKQINTALREGNGAGLPVMTRLALLEQRMALSETSTRLSRDWWFKVAGNIATTTIIGIAGVLLAVYLLTKGVKP